MAKLHCLKPRLERAPTLVATHTTAAIRKRGHTGMVNRERIVRRDQGLCQRCLSAGRYTEGSEVDHIVALVNGGPDTDENKQLLCRNCHAEKTREDVRGGGRG